MKLKLYNTLTRSKDPFHPLEPGNVRMYVCGPTVYDFAHIGNARPVIVFDVLYRLLRHLYGAGHVKYVRNITDVDDKINARAAEEYPGLPLNDAIRKVTEKTERQFHEDVAALGCLKPDAEPRATEYVRRDDGTFDMVTLIQKLIDNGNAYEKERHVLFRVGSMPDYGKLAGRSLDEMIAGSRVEIAPFKENPMDFVLWKPSSENEPGWESPWGRGRPGWHIECSAMSAALLGKEFDIHGGGIDLVFPHHENELAQTRCAFHSDRMAQVWMHNGFLQVEGAKMAKSAGNFIVNRQLLQRVAGSALRFTMLKTHYREPFNWTELSLQESRRELSDWSEFVAALPTQANQKSEIDRDVLGALSDDLNTSEAITRMRFLFKSAQSDPEKYLGRLVASAKFLGFEDISKSGHFRIGVAYYVPKGNEAAAHRAHQLSILARAALANKLPEAAPLLREIEATGATYRLTDDGDISISFSDKSLDEVVVEKIEFRNAARKAKNFREADRIRDELEKMGVVLKDNKDGTTTWELAR